MVRQEIKMVNGQIVKVKKTGDVVTGFEIVKNEWYSQAESKVFN